ncbi:DUF4349 domain-containing protein [Mucilaginibacter sabulilitoris]|uniref:DUF4349 domain-containing protein n=1 Tax=Mucilaginibacter sabulilitoris TaxID=1173583 RepID=A0ABZ0TMV3_9SPHI|nr:DUF4349 domain-containing protein [Mucilaginibacter sabulilitoris]WPU94194.1 DUF4349 domain-containing protein [Mucilaginibacter sabulilitoris]
MKTYLISVSLLLVLSGCGHKPTVEKETVAAVSFAPPPVKADNELYDQAATAEGNAIAKPSGDADVKVVDDAIRDTSKKIIKNGSIEFETANVNAIRKRILHSLKKYGGYVDEDNQSTNSDANRKEYNLKISIPAKYFDFLIDSVSASADKINSKNISITDVTTRYIDIKTRLANKKILENRYLELLKRGTKISDLLEIENKLTEIRSDIESTQGQLNYLNKQVAYSSLDITFYTQHVEKTDKGTGPGYKFKTAMVSGWDFLQNLFFGIIAIWPVILIIVLIYWIIKNWRKRRRAK